MPMVTLDGRSLLLDGRRIWLSGGQIPYASLPRDIWADRIWAAKAAGLNCVYTPVIWSRHEPRPGKFDFTGENDLPHFIQLIGQAGMHCILGMGPHVGGSYDLGGIPPWVLEMTSVKLRTANTAFLEACSRYLTNLSEHVRSLQVTSGGGGGPIIMVQCESRWTCGDPALAQSYLGELLRYIHEAGINVPVINANSLWQGVEGMLDAWSGRDDMLATMRQLAVVRPMQPRLVVDFPLAEQPVWGQPAPKLEDSRLTQRRLAEVLAGGGQFNLSPFCSGTNLGFSGGRLDDAPNTFAATETGKGGLLDPAGAQDSAYRLVRRVTHLASRFGRVFAHLDPAYQPVGIAPMEPQHLLSDMAAKAKNGAKGAKAATPAKNAKAPAPIGPVPGGVAVVHTTGSQGSIAFLFDQEAVPAQGALQPRTTTLLLQDGSILPITLGEQLVAWCLFNVHISGRATLDYTNLCAFASVGQVLVLFGPAGSRGRVSVNGSPLDVDVPTSKEPIITALEGLTIVIANEQQIDQIYAVDDGVFIGVLDVSQDGTPVLPAGTRSYFKVMGDGSTRTVTPQNARTSASIPDAPALSAWQAGDVDEYADGTCPRYAKIETLQDLTRLGSPSGYGWYRMTLKGTRPRKAQVMLPFAADRAHVFLDAKPLGVVGEGPGSVSSVGLNLKKGEQSLVVLAENLGRFSDGLLLGEHKGLWGAIYEVAPIKSIKAKLVEESPIEYLGFRKPLWDASVGDTTGPERVQWTLPHRKKTPILVRFDTPAPPGCLLIVNGTTLEALSPAGPRQVVLSADQLGKGTTATVQIAFHEMATDADRQRVAEGVSFFDCVEDIVEDARLAFAKWEPPSPATFSPAKKGVSGGLAKWWRSSFVAADTQSALYLECTGLTKGQIYVNGRHAARYFVGTADGEAVPPQVRYRLPRPWLKFKQANDLLVFDEHGASPAKARLIYDRGRFR